MRSIVLAFAFVVATSAFADDCQHVVYGDASIFARGVTRVTFAGRVGILHVHGDAAAKEIRADGRACVAEKELAAGIRLKATRAGNTVTIDAEVPKREDATSAAQPSVDLAITLPKNVAVEIDLPRGEVLIRDVASVHIALGEGIMMIWNISGSVTIDEHRSGRTVVSDVGGDLVINKPIDVEYTRIAGRVISSRQAK